jgi:hypothetical protein
MRSWAAEQVQTFSAFAGLAWTDGVEEERATAMRSALNMRSYYLDLLTSEENV